ncbi:hypothetical protein [Methylobacterium persicinum]|uniref:Uncharacterized protein n=1 Tax=Methylobacterium persicinum TaxID=374426 RepID=A0ABU0HSB7_9HYPH|nr:hypothetical protein [Methylobacterium persicinum]MDQ0445201.1 hypothetical protein [Methylobacterium persicinum]
MTGGSARSRASDADAGFCIGIWPRDVFRFGRGLHRCFAAFMGEPVMVADVLFIAWLLAIGVLIFEMP